MVIQEIAENIGPLQHAAGFNCESVDLRYEVAFLQSNTEIIEQPISYLLRILHVLAELIRASLIGYVFVAVELYPLCFKTLDSHLFFLI